MAQGVVYGITAPCGELDGVAQVARLIAGGVKIIQYRDKKKHKELQLQEAKKIATLCKENKVVFLVNDDAQLALASSADGVHLGQEDLKPKLARELLGPRAIIGLSTHNPKEAQGALAEPIDYIGVGPMFETQTKQFESLAGLEYLKYCVENIPLPMVCIGGIDINNVTQLRAKGAKTVALIGELQRAKDLEATVAEIEKILAFR